MPEGRSKPCRDIYTHTLSGTKTYALPVSDDLRLEDLGLVQHGRCVSELEILIVVSRHGTFETLPYTCCVVVFFHASKEGRLEEA